MIYISAASEHIKMLERLIEKNTFDLKMAIELRDTVQIKRIKRMLHILKTDKRKLEGGD